MVCVAASKAGPKRLPECEGIETQDLVAIVVEAFRPKRLPECEGIETGIIALIMKHLPWSEEAARMRGY